MANNPMIKFLRGSQAGFEGLGTYEAGVFYLTKDTNRLYIGNDDKTASLLNQGVQVVQNVAALPSAPPAHDGDFIYCIDENVLAYYDGTANSGAGGWTQINPDTRNKSVAIGATVSGKVATITSSVTDKTTKSDTMTITAGNNVSLSADKDGNLTISATNTDTSTTKAGHYTPSDKDETLGDATGKVIHQIKVDSKKHVTEIVERNENRNSAVALSAANDGENSNKVVVTSSVKDAYATKSGSMNISGAGATTVTAGADGSIVISSTDTDTKVTSAANHYAPVADDNSKLSVGANKFATGVSRDAKGHVTAITGASSQEDVAVAVVGGTNTATVTTSAKNLFGTADSDAFNVVGAGATTISGDATNKKITVSSTDRSVTEAQYHYSPSEDTNSALDATNKLITKVHRDSKGHVTGITTGDSAEDFSMAAASVTGGATITGTAKNIAGTAKSGGVTVKGGGATSVSVDDGGNVVISSVDTKVTSVENHYTPSGGTTLSASGGTATSAKATTQVITGITRDAAGHITGVTSAGISDTHNALSSVDLSVSTDKKLSLSVATTDGTKSDTIALDVKYGKNAAGTSYHTTANLIQNGNANAGKWDLDVYTTAEVDAKISSAVGANGAVQVVGTVDKTHPLPSTNIKTGDTYIVAEKHTYNGQAATSGDMFIASGNHTTGTVASGFWYYIPAGNEAVQLASRTNGFELKEGNSSTVVGAVEFDAYSASSNDFQVVAEVTNASSGGYNKTSVSFNMYWGSF